MQAAQQCPQGPIQLAGSHCCCSATTCRFNDKGVMHMPPLAPGDPLWAELREEANARRALEAASAEAAAAQLRPDSSFSAGLAPGSAKGAPAAEAAEAAEVGDLEASSDCMGSGMVTAPAPAAAGPVDVGPGSSRNVVLLYGPPHAGVSTQAALLAKRYQLPVVTLDGLIAEALELKPPPPEPEVQPRAAAEPVHTAAGVEPGSALEQIREEEGEAGGAEGAAAAAATDTAAEGAEPAAPARAQSQSLSTAPSVPSRSASPTGKGSMPQAPSPLPAAPSPEPLAPAMAAIDVVAVVAELKHHLLDRPSSSRRLQQAELQALLQDALTLVLAQPRYAAGFIVDGLACKHLQKAAAATVLLQAVGFTRVQRPQLQPPLATSPPPAAKGPGKAAPVKKPSVLEPAPEPPKVPDMWRGPHALHVVQLQTDKETFLARYTSSSKGDAAGQHGHAATPHSTSSSGAAVERTTSIASPATSTGHASPGSARRSSQSGQHHSHQDEAEAAWHAFQAEAPALALLLSGKEPGTRLVYRELAISAAVQEVYRSLCGISWHMGKSVSVLPAAPEDEELIPEPYCMQVRCRDLQLSIAGLLVTQCASTAELMHGCSDVPCMHGGREAERPGCCDVVAGRDDAWQQQWHCLTACCPACCCRWCTGLASVPVAQAWPSSRCSPSQAACQWSSRHQSMHLCQLLQQARQAAGRALAPRLRAVGPSHLPRAQQLQPRRQRRPQLGRRRPRTQRRLRRQLQQHRLCSRLWSTRPRAAG